MLSTQDIKDRVDLTDVLSRYGIKLNNAGFACCPFHSEKTPSFKVYNERKKYHCFGCGKGGDVITFYMDYFNTDFKEALKIMDKEHGLNLFHTMSPKERKNIEIQAKNRKREQQQKEEEKRYNEYAYSRLCDFRRWLLKQEQNGITKEYIERIDYELDNFDVYKKKFNKNIDMTLHSLYTLYKTDLEKYEGFMK